MSADLFRLRFATCNYFVGEEELKVEIQADMDEKASGLSIQLCKVGLAVRQPGLRARNSVIGFVARFGHVWTSRTLQMQVQSANVHEGFICQGQSFLTFQYVPVLHVPLKSPPIPMFLASVFRHVMAVQGSPITNLHQWCLNLLRVSKSPRPGLSWIRLH